MKSAVKLSVRAFALAACIAGTAASSLLAGEPIIIGKAKDRTEPGKESKAETGLFGKSIGKVEGTDPFQALGPSMLPNIQPRNYREEQRRRNEADEKANWLLLDKGDLTKNNEAFGVDDRRYSADGLEKEDKSRDYTFRNVKGGSKPGFKNGKPNAELMQQIKKSRKDNDEAELLTNGKEPGGIHTASDLDFQKMLNPGKMENGILGSAKSDFSLRELFNNPSPSIGNKLQEAHAAKFNDFLNGPSLATVPDPFKSPVGAFQGGGPAVDFTPKAPPASTPLFPGAAMPGIASPAYAVPAMDPNYGRVNSYSSPSPAAREPARSYIPAPKEFPRRSF